MRRAIMAALIALAPGVAWAQDGDAAVGHAVAQTWCASCHAVEVRPTAAGDAVPSFAAIANRPGVTPDSLRAFIAAPHGRMPNLSLSRNDIENTVAYLLSLKKP